jgi:hypothetical protein
MLNANTPEIPETGKKAVVTVGGTAVASAIIGSFIPGAGTVIGAGIGGIIGGIVVIVNAMSDNEQSD